MPFIHVQRRVDTCEMRIAPRQRAAAGLRQRSGPDVINSFQMNNGRAAACLTESDNIIYMSVTVTGA